MFKIPTSFPDNKSSIDELADFIEWECIKNDSISILTATKPVLVSNDEIDAGGIDDESDILSNRTDDIIQEIGRRNRASGLRYPFTLDNKGYTIRVNKTTVDYWVYTYLLLSTRLNMLKHKELGGIDGTEILEKLSSLSAKEYFGQRADSVVFGTATAGSFQDKITDLINRIGEGHSFVDRDGLTIRAKDDKLDIVVWKNFSDGSHSKLIGFGQCKTGTSWDDKETIELQPDGFCKKWFRDIPVVNPVKMFFASQTFPLSHYSKSVNAGLVFDRSRIIDYLPATINDTLLGEIRTWCTAALQIIS